MRRLTLVIVGLLAAGLAPPASAQRFLVPTYRAVSVDRPELDPPQGVEPVVELLPIDVDGRILPLAGPLKLDAPDNTVIFRFRTISFLDEKSVRFRVWLEGFDAEWLKLQELPQRSIRYTNLPPGEYRFHIQAVDARGARSEVASSPPIRIHRALINNPWIRGALVLSMLGAFASGIIVWAQRRYARELEGVVQARTEELRETERELARAHRMEALGVLAGGIAHDFNNLLQVILGGASLLEVTADLNGRSRTILRELKGAGKRAQALTDQLLTFAKGGEPIRKRTALAPVVRESAAFALAGAVAPPRMEIAEDLWPVDVDSAQIARALDNLILNARQAMPQGPVTVRAFNVGSAPHPAPQVPHVLIEVRDEGPGIPETEIGRIFDPFFSTKSQGTGLGLAVAHSVVERHGGHLSVESATDRGTTFRLRLPAISRERVAAVPAGPIRDSAGTGGRRILVMEDEDAVRRALVEILSEIGYETTATADGATAVETYRRAHDLGHPHDALLLDLRVPEGLGGREALKRIHAFHPDARAVVITGYSDDPVLARATEFGFRAALAKPFTAKELDAVLKQVLGAPRTAGRT